MIENFRKMGDLTLNCPLCCNKIFSSKDSLIEHISNAIQNIYCPVCKIKSSNIIQLIEHMSLDNCTPVNSGSSFELENDEPSCTELPSENVNPLGSIGVESAPSTSDIKIVDTYSQLPTSDSFESTDINNMYVDLMKPCLETQEMIKGSNEGRFVIIAEDDGSFNDEWIVTKQNMDGTISLTTVKDMKMEENGQGVIDSSNELKVPELYSCNTCEMSFTSVIDHIQNYHSNQDVVVEGAIDATDTTMTSMMPTDYQNMDVEQLPFTDEKQASRRVITETGDIVETPFDVKSNATSDNAELIKQDQPNSALNEQAKPETVEIKNRGSKRYVQIEKLCESVIQDIKEPEVKNGPFHKVAIKQVKSADGNNIKMYYCLTCHLYASMLNDFKGQPCKIAKYSCSQCSVTYDNSKSLCAHMKVHKVKPEVIATEIRESYTCEICFTEFVTNKSLKLHKRMHDPVKSRPIDPPRNCGKADVFYHCRVCDKIMPDAYRDVHDASHNNVDKMLNCTICNKKFSSTEYLDMHMKVHCIEKTPQNNPDKTLPYCCIYCDRRFARPHEKVKHERIHTGEKPHTCEVCGKSFRVSYCLTLHMRTHTGARPYACPHCGKRFKAHSVYNHHLLTHSEVRAFKCPFCPKAFKTSVQLAGHKNSHTKPFACTQCNRPFASLYAVRVHTETHSRHNNLKFSCTECGASYARSFALKDHMKQAHKDVDTKGAIVEENWASKKSLQDTETLARNKSVKLEMGINSDEFIVPN